MHLHFAPDGMIANTHVHHSIIKTSWDSDIKWATTWIENSPKLQNSSQQSFIIMHQLIWLPTGYITQRIQCICKWHQQRLLMHLHFMAKYITQAAYRVIY